MCKLLTSKRTKDGELVLHELDDTWLPWKFQVSRFVDDGKDYGKPGHKIRVSQANFIDQLSATGAFNRTS